LLSKSYKGGLFCCQDNFKCKLRKGFSGPIRKLSLRYKIRWVDWDERQVPLKFYILDSTDRVRLNGSNLIHDCQVNDLFNIYYILQMIRKLLKPTNIQAKVLSYSLLFPLVGNINLSICYMQSIRSQEIMKVTPLMSRKQTSQ